ncbi:hypothetical protein MAPG_04328 [Magnaporthiopsis poae ATCC 64411]|uniref:Uncharacterized protein n=1 Tax=Magnaporthiopsis poae (strain ATCC 64411 / 73-15) TaxID=644358 RepID=A0A0C4DWF2_MAGP6|nr:hypothetical protein MAPG_04328 [Magnaporthiopsis poae ATCC 64411]
MMAGNVVGPVQHMGPAVEPLRPDPDRAGEPGCSCASPSARAPTTRCLARRSCSSCGRRAKGRFLGYLGTYTPWTSPFRRRAAMLCRMISTLMRVSWASRRFFYWRRQHGVAVSSNTVSNLTRRSTPERPRLHSSQTSQHKYGPGYLSTIQDYSY